MCIFRTWSHDIDTEPQAKFQVLKGRVQVCKQIASCITWLKKLFAYGYCKHGNDLNANALKAGDKQLEGYSSKVKHFKSFRYRKYQESSSAGYLFECIYNWHTQKWCEWLAYTKFCSLTGFTINPHLQLIVQSTFEIWHEFQMLDVVYTSCKRWDMHEQEWKCQESDTKLVHGLMGRLAGDNLTLCQED